MIPALLLILSAVAYRIVTGLFAIIPARPGFRTSRRSPRSRFARPPISRRNYKFTVPLVALLISDVVLNIHYGAPLFSPSDRLRATSRFALVGCLGLLLQNRASLKTLASGFDRRLD